MLKFLGAVWLLSVRGLFVFFIITKLIVFDFVAILWVAGVWIVFELSRGFLRRLALNRRAAKISSGEHKGEFAVYLRPFREDFYVAASGDAAASVLQTGLDVSTEKPLPLGAFIEKSFKGVWPIVGLGRNFLSYFSRGPGLARATNAQWRETITHMLDRATAIFVIPSHKEGTQWELTRLLENHEWLKKTVFFMPHFDAQVMNAVHLQARIWRMRQQKFSKRSKVSLSKGLGLTRALRKMRREALFNWIYLRTITGDAIAIEKKLKRKWAKAKLSTATIGLSLSDYHHRGAVFVFNHQLRPVHVCNLASVSEGSFRKAVQEAMAKSMKDERWDTPIDEDESTSSGDRQRAD